MGLPFDIVPNYVHYILLDVKEIEFGHFISLLSVLKNQRPERIYIHCNCHQLSGQYNKRVLRVCRKLDVQIVVRDIDDQWLNLQSVDLLRLQVLMDWGGTYLDTGMYIVKSLNTFFKYEMTLDLEDNETSNKIVISHPKARYLRLLYNSYLFYNQKNNNSLQNYLKHRPELVHRVRGLFGCNGRKLCSLLYNSYYKNWETEFHSIQMLIRGNQVNGQSV